MPRPPSTPEQEAEMLAIIATLDGLSTKEIIVKMREAAHRLAHTREFLVWACNNADWFKSPEFDQAIKELKAEGSNV